MRTLFLFLFQANLITSCSSESDNPSKMDLSIRLLGNPQCNYLKSSGNISETFDSQSCVDFEFDGDNRKLILKHLNAAFNCCPESLWCTVDYHNDTIRIQEFERSIGCKCNCLYNLDIEIEGVEQGKYWLKLNEPYLGGQEPLVFQVDLWSLKKGQFCVARSNYPWR